jgi:hypothetical protein
MRLPLALPVRLKYVKTNVYSHIRQPHAAVKIDLRFCRKDRAIAVP